MNNFPARALPDATRPLKYRVNRGLLIWSLVLVAAAAGGSYGLRKFFIVRNAAQLLERASSAAESGDRDRASQLYSQYLQLTKAAARSPAAREQRAEVLVTLGQLLEQLEPTPGSVPRIVQTYEEALRLNGELEVARYRLIPLLTLMRRFPDALLHIDALKSGALSDARAAELAFRAARCHELLDKRSDAQKQYRESIERLPGQLSSYLALGRMWATESSAIELLTHDGKQEAEFQAQWPEFQALSESVKSSDVKPTNSAIVLLLDRMVEKSPGMEAKASRAISLLTLKVTNEPLDSTKARERTESILLDADADRNGELAGSELWRATVPPLADANRDKQVSAQELENGLMAGDVAMRRREAETLLEPLLQSPPDESQTALNELLINIIDAKLDSSSNLPAEGRNALLAESRTLIADALNRFPQDARFQFLVAELELRSAQGEDSLDIRQAHLTEAETALRQGLETNASSPQRPQTDEWLSPWTVPNPTVVQLQLQYQLGEVLLAQVALHPTSSAEKLAEIQQIAAVLRKGGADARLPSQLEFRMAIVQPKTERATLLAMAKTLARDVGQATKYSRDLAERLGSLYMQFGDPGTALEIYRRQLKAEPLWIAGRVGMAEILYKLGRIDEAIPHYEAALNRPGVAERLAVILMVQQAQRPADVRDWRRIKSVLEHVQPTTPDLVQGKVLRSEIMSLEAVTLSQLARDRQDPKLQERARQLLQSAENYLREALREQPQSVALWTALASALLRRDDLTIEERLSQVAQLLDEARTSVGPHAELALVELNVAQQRKEKGALAVAERLAGELETFPEQGKTRLVLAIGETLAAFEQPTAARTVMFQQAQLMPDDLDLQLAVNRALFRDFRLDDPEWEAQWTSNLSQIERLEGTPQGSALLAKAQRLLSQSAKAPQPGNEAARAETLKQARNMLNVARRARPYSSAVVRALGFLDDDAGNLEAAGEAYREARLLGDHSPIVVTRLVDVYFRQGRYDDAERLLSQVAAEQANAISGDLARLAWQVAGRRGQDERAIEIASRLAGETGSDRDRLAASALKFSHGQYGPDVLLPLRKMAYELSPQNLQSWFLLVLYYTRVENWSAAEQAIADAEEQTHLDQKVAKNAVAIAQFWEMLATSSAPDSQRYLAESTRRYDAAVRNFPDDAQTRVMAIEHYVRTNALERARTNLTDLLDPSRAVPVLVRAWANRQQAALQARSGTYEDTRTALAALERAETTGADNSPSNLRLRLQLLQQFPNADLLAKQALILTQLQAIDASKPEKMTDGERLMFASVLDRLDRWTEAQTQYRKLLESRPDLTRARVEYCSAMLRRAATLPELLDVVASELNRLQQDEPRSLRTTIIHAQWLAARGQTAEAAAAMSAFATARLKARGENRFLALLQQEKPEELFQALAVSVAADQRTAVVAALRSAAALLREGKTEEAARGLATSAAAPILDQQLFYSALDGARQMEAWDAPAAEALYKQCVAANDSGEAPRELARFYVKSGHLDEALAICETHWDRITPAGVAFLMSMLVRTDLEVPAAKLQEWRERLLKASETMAPAERGTLLLHLANFDNEAGRYEEAIAEYQRANAASGRRFDSLNNFAFLSARTGKNLPEAAEAIESALRMAGSRPDLQDTRAMVLIAQDRLAEARDLLQDLTAQHADAASLFRLAECYHRQKEPALASAALKLAFDKGLMESQLHPLDRVVLQELQATAP